MAYFNGLAGIDVVHIPLKATGEAINEVVAGRAQAVIAASIGALAFANDRRVRLIGVTSPKRSRYLPGIPTIGESGLPGYQFDSWFGLLGPAATPASEVSRINTAMAATSCARSAPVFVRSVAVATGFAVPTVQANSNHGQILLCLW